jgi:hypothetical protein
MAIFVTFRDKLGYATPLIPCLRAHDLLFFCNKINEL